MPGTVTVTGAALGLPDGEHVFGPVTVVGTVTVESEFAGALASGDTTVAVPTGAVQALITLPPGLSVTVKVRTNLNSGDAGLPLTPPAAATQELVLTFPIATGVTSIILNASGTTTGSTTVTFV